MAVVIWLVLRVLGAVWVLGASLSMGAPGLLAVPLALLVLLGQRWVRPALVAVRSFR